MASGLRLRSADKSGNPYLSNHFKNFTCRLSPVLLITHWAWRLQQFQMLVV